MQRCGALSGIALSFAYRCRRRYITLEFLHHAICPLSLVGRESWSFLGLYRPPIESVCESLAAPVVGCCLSQPCFHCAQYWRSHWMLPPLPPHSPCLPLPAGDWDVAYQCVQQRNKKQPRSDMRKRPTSDPSR